MFGIGDGGVRNTYPWSWRQHSQSKHLDFKRSASNPSLGMFQIKKNFRRFCIYFYSSRITKVTVLVEAVICVKKDDLYVSDSIAKTGAWEAENVHNLMKAMSLYKDAVLVGKFLYRHIFF